MVLHLKTQVFLVGKSLQIPPPRQCPWPYLCQLSWWHLGNFHLCPLSSLFQLPCWAHNNNTLRRSLEFCSYWSHVMPKRTVGSCETRSCRIAALLVACKSQTLFWCFLHLNDSYKTCRSNRSKTVVKGQILLLCAIRWYHMVRLKALCKYPWMHSSEYQ